MNNNYTNLEIDSTDGVYTPKNYIPNANCGNNTTAGWSLGYIDGGLVNGLPAPAATLTIGGASGTLSLTTDTVTPIRGASTLSLVSSGATTAGNALISDNFVIDPADRAKVLTYKFYFQVASGASNGNFSGTSANSFAVAFYDTLNGVYLPVCGAFAMTQNSGVGIATGTVQMGASTGTGRFIIYNSAASAGAITVNFDDISVSPQVSPVGPTMTQWENYTPTVVGMGTVSITESQWKRVGDSLYIRGKLTTGTTTATTASITLPAGLVIDPLRVTSIGDVGRYIFAATAAANYTLLASPSGTVLNFGYSNGSVANLAPLLGNQINVNGTAMSYSAGPIPISGWSSNTQMSNDTDTRVISFNGTQVTQANTSLVTNIALTANRDTAGAWNGTQYVVPVAGDYMTSFTHIVNVAHFPAIYLNGNLVQYGTFQGSASQSSSGSVFLPGLKPGDLISFRNGGTGTITISSGSIHRLSGPAVIAATESVNASYTINASSAVLSVTNSSTDIILDYNSRIMDSHNAVTTGASWRFTAPVSGKYAVNAGLTFGTWTTPAGAAQFQIFKNGVFFSRMDRKATTTDGQFEGSLTLVSMNAGDYIDIRMNNGSGSAMQVFSTTGYSTVSIYRIGN